MLLEPGPIDPIDVDRWTRTGPPSTLAADAAQLASQLAVARGVISTHQATMAGDSSAIAVVNAGPALEEQQAELARQTNALDPSIGSVAAAALGQEGTIVGLSNESGQAIADAVEPQAGERPSSYRPEKDWKGGDGGNGNGDGDGGGGENKQQFISRLYHTYLRRDPGVEGIEAWAPLWPNKDAIEHGILFSDEYAADVSGLYEQYFGRGAGDGELAEHRAHKDSLDAIEANLRARA